MAKQTILIAGASGIVGRAALEHFGALADWEVIGVSRSDPKVDVPFTHLSVDLTDKEACEAAFSNLSEVSHVVFAALYEKPGLIEGWRDPEQMQTNLAMLDNLYTPLSRAARGLEHISLLQGTKAYGAHIKPIRVPARESWPRDPHDNFYWLQEDYLREREPDADWSWTILRPQVIFGHALGAPMNLIAAIGAYAAIRRAEGKPLSFPGGPPYVVEAVDARLLARALEWAAVTPACGNEIFNITNGDVFCWPYVWPAICAALGMEIGEPEPMLLHEEMPAKSALWDEMVKQHNLQPNSLEQLVGDSFYYADFGFATGRDRSPPPALVSTIKARQFGFDDCIDTEDMFRYWFQRLQQMKVLPPAE